MLLVAARLAAAAIVLFGQVRRVGRLQYDAGDVLTTPQLVDKHGYVMEEYQVTTEDGYLLTLHRMLPPRRTKDRPWPFFRLWGPRGGGREPGDTTAANCSRPPVLIQHGLMGSSADWTLPGPTRGLPYILVDAGYDVWLGNSRGNAYSRNHTSLHPETDKENFWDFSWHEMGVYDLPACIDHILRVNGEERLFYIGYSQGTTTFFVMGSERPEVSCKVRAMLALAPIAFMSHVRSPLVRMAARFDGAICALFRLLGMMHELTTRNDFMDSVGAAFCRSQAVNKDVCSNVLFLMAGYTSKQLDTTLLPLIMGVTPSGAATKQVVHYGQGIKSGRFRHFDYGERNHEIYGSTSPPDYTLSGVEVPTALFFSKNDWLAGTQDVMKLYQMLPDRIGLFPVEDPEFTHLDFMWGECSRELVYDRVLAIMKRY